MTDEDVEFSVEIENGATLIELIGDRDCAVVVYSDSGERIYLPPEDFERPAGRTESSYQTSRDDSPYQSSRSDSAYQGATSDSPYQGSRNDSPYQSARVQMPEEGLQATKDGFLIRHPEPVTDVRLLR